MSRVGIIAWYERINTLVMIGIASISYIALIQQEKYKWLWVLIIGWISAVVIEYIGIHTCMPYGCFSYSDILGTKIAQTVPRTVFFGRTPLVIGLYTILQKYTIPKRIKIFIGWISLMIIDLVIDPAAVTIGFRNFTAGWRYYNIPRTNFAWRILSGIIGTMQCIYIIPRHTYNPKITYSMLLTLSFFTFFCIRSAMWIPSIIGIITMIILFNVSNK